MAETFTGPLVWITMCGNIDVRHPDGRLVRCYGMSQEHSREADRLGKKAFCTVEIPDDIPGRGKFSPRITAVADMPPAITTSGTSPSPAALDKETRDG